MKKKKATGLDIEPIAKRLRETTPGSWGWQEGDTDTYDDYFANDPTKPIKRNVASAFGGICEVYTPNFNVHADDAPSGFRRGKDWEFLCSAKRDVTRLLKEVRRLRKMLRAGGN